MTATDPLRNAIHQLARLPGVGEKTATRLIYWLLKQDPQTSLEIGTALCSLPDSIKRCQKCCNISPMDICAMCANTKRDNSIICVVERPQDIESIESTGEFHGTYHVLDGCISPLEGIGPEHLRIRELLERLKQEEPPEILIATDPDTEGDATAMYLAHILKPIGIRVTRLAHGIAVGTELSYANKTSVACALLNRREL